MQLKILLNNFNDLDNLGHFLNNWLLPAIKQSLRQQLQNYTQVINKYLKEKNHPNIFNILEEAINNNLQIYYNNTINSLTITINYNAFSQEENAKLYDICAMVNFGTLECPKCPIFTKVFDKYAKNFWLYYKGYQLGVLPCP